MQGGVRDEVGSATTGARRLATPTEVATYLQVPVRTLYTWRYHRKGPWAHRVGRHLRYRWEDVGRGLRQLRPADDPNSRPSRPTNCQSVGCGVRVPRDPPSILSLTCDYSRSVAVRAAVFDLCVLDVCSSVVILSDDLVRRPHGRETFSVRTPRAHRGEGAEPGSGPKACHPDRPERGPGELTGSR